MLRILMGVSRDHSLVIQAASDDTVYIAAETGRPVAEIQSLGSLYTVGILVTSDLVALVVASALAGLFASTTGSVSGWDSLVRYGYLVILAPLAYALVGLYPAVAMSPVDELRRITITTSALFLASIAGVAVVAGVVPAPVVLIAGVLALLTVPAARAASREAFAGRRWWGVPVVVLGAGKTAELVIESLQANRRVAMRVVACLDDDADKVGGHVRGVPVTGVLADVTAFQHRGVRHVIVAMPGVPPSRLTYLLRRYCQGFPSMVVVPNLFGVSSVGLGTRDLGGVVGLHVNHSLLSRGNRVAKVCIDLALLVPALLIGVPVVALAALAVMIVSPGNPFYAQEREGLGGRTIRVFKLRTMYRNADALLEEYLRANPESRRTWERNFKLHHDPRILPFVGRLLRLTSLDELPQVINVARGDMSFIGPRPFPQYHLDAFSRDFRELRSMVRPGITGLWQVTARSDGDIRVQEEADTFYIRNWSIWMDLYVLARTPIAVLSAKGAR